MQSIKYIVSIISVWLISSAYLYNITGKSECFWFILFNMSALSIFGIMLYACIGFIGNKLLKKEVREEMREEIVLKARANQH